MQLTPQKDPKEQSERFDCAQISDHKLFHIFFLMIHLNKRNRNKYMVRMLNLDVNLEIDINLTE